MDCGFWLVAVACAALLCAVVSLYITISGKVKMKREMAAGMSVRITPEGKEELAGSLAARFGALRKIYGTLYLTCDNFPRNMEKVAETAAELYEDGSLSALCNDIVQVTNMCEGGAIYRMGRQYRLTPVELRTCCFIYWGFRWQETCTAESLTENAYNVRCSRIRKKFSLGKDERIPDFIADYCRRNITLSGQ